MDDRDVRKFNERADHYETDWLGTYFHRPVQETTLDISARLVPAPTDGGTAVHRLGQDLRRRPAHLRPRGHRATLRPRR
jgi:hypothetical protein